MITDCQKANEGFFIHTGAVTGGMVAVGETVTATVDANTRRATMRNHTSAHLLQAALRSVLGDHVHQAGSYVDPRRVRFDFAHYEAMTPEEIAQAETLVNEKILEALPVAHKVMALEEAKQLGAMALFGEKYGDTVRVIDVQDFSIEFCGGTHVYNTSELGLFKILSESSVAAGVRRIEATTGFGVLELLAEQKKLLDETSAAFKLANHNELPAKAAALAASLKTSEQEIGKLNAKLASSAAADLEKGAVDVEGLTVLAARVEGVKADALKTMADTLKASKPGVVAVLASVEGERVTLCAACGADAVKRGVKAGAVVKEAAARIGGSGGGKPDIAMAGGKDASKLDEALSSVAEIVKKQLG